MWECVQAAGYYKLDNFIMVIDANGQQVEGAIENQMTEEPSGCPLLSPSGPPVSPATATTLTISSGPAPWRHPGRPLAVICRTWAPPACRRWRRSGSSCTFVRIPEAERAEYQKIYDEM